MYLLGYSCLLQHFAQLIDFILLIASLVGTDLEVGSCFEMPPLSRGSYCSSFFRDPFLLC